MLDFIFVNFIFLPFQCSLEMHHELNVFKCEFSNLAEEIMLQ